MIYVINLDRSTDRLANFTAANGHLAIERFPAVDGHSLDTVYLKSQRLVEVGAETAFSPGNLGCALSHLALWRVAAKRATPTTIFEDDAVAHHQFESLADRVIATLPAGWTMVMWGWNFNAAIVFDFLPGASACRANFNQGRLRRGIRHYQSLPLTPVAYRLGGCFGTVGYTVSPSGARTLAETVFPIRRSTVLCPHTSRPTVPFPVRGLDFALHAVFALGSAYVSFPPLVVTGNEREGSTIQAPQTR